MEIYTFDVEKIANYLRSIQKNIDKVYAWNANLEGLITLQVLTFEKVYELNQLSNYEKEIALKFLVEKKLQEYFTTDQKDQFEKLCMWIINEWGGIKGAKPHTTMPRIYDFIASEKPKYDYLPSVSKVGMFMYTNKNIIYDTRVIYALNWILLTEKAGSHFFPIPGGRNTKMNAFDMNVLIRQSKAHLYKPEKRSDLNKRNYIEAIDNMIFIPQREAYFQARVLLKKVNELLWDANKSNYPFYTEMLLFSSADVEIFNDITRKYSK